jgi:hypothetical protein
MRRRNFAALVLCGSLLLNGTYARAEGEAAVVGVVAAGLIGTSYFAYEGGLLGELKDWTDPKSETSSQLIGQCDVKLDVRLHGNNAYNFISIIAANDGQGVLVFPYEETRFDFSTSKGPGASRLASMPHSLGPKILQPTETWGVLLIFPSKDDFKDADRLTVSMPFMDPRTKRTCEAVATFNRNAEVPREERTGESYTSGQTRFGFGSALTRSGNHEILGSPGFNFDLTFAGYKKKHWGFFFSMHTDSFADTNSAAMAGTTGSAALDPSLVMFYFAVGGAYREMIGERWTLTYELGPALAMASYRKVGNEDKYTSTHFAVHQALSAAYRISRKREGPWRGDYKLGVSVTSAWMPGFADFENVPASGHSLGLLGFLAVEW